MTLHSHCFSSCWLAQDALHNGRYGSEVQLCLCLDGTAGDDTARAVSLVRRQAQHGRHQGQSGSEVHLSSDAWMVLLVKMQLALCPFFVDRPKMLGFRAGMTQKNSYAAIQRPLPVVCNDICLWFRLYKTVESLAVEVLFDRCHPCRGADCRLLMVLHRRVSPFAVH